MDEELNAAIAAKAAVDTQPHYSAAQRSQFYESAGPPTQERIDQAKSAVEDWLQGLRENHELIARLTSAASQRASMGSRFTNQSLI